jgi:hypothetical protein
MQFRLCDDVHVKNSCMTNVSLGIPTLHKCSWQVEVATHGDFFFGGVLRVPSCDLRGEIQGLTFIGCT